ncbi:MAG: glucose-6-phosphate dehydrogenase [Planctomycetota bacterium]
MATAPEPTEHSTRTARVADACTMVIFGATGDLTKRKLLPALHNLYLSELLPRDFAIVGFARGEATDAAFRAAVRDDSEVASSGIDAAAAKWFEERIHYVGGGYDDPAAFKRLRATLDETSRRHGTRGNAIYYLATPPELFNGIVTQLAAEGLTQEQANTWRRVIVEKPFGRDLESARQLNQDLQAKISEQQIYRIDHYLGKETVQNILVFRFANGIFEPIWNRQYIDHVQITVAESVGVEERAGYYENAGALRDMVQNHLFQLLALIAMEPPSSFGADAVRDEKTKALRAIQPLTLQDVLNNTVRGQYGSGLIGDRPAPGYRQEKRVNPSSSTETFVAMRLTIDNWRWAGVPFYLRTGKRLAQRTTEIAIQFKAAPQVMFRGTASEVTEPNSLVLHLQPREGISLNFQAKRPGAVVETGEVTMDFEYSKHFGTQPSTGYETLLFDCMCGDPTLFQRADSVEAGWKVVMPILDFWQGVPERAFPNYSAGSDGPKAADLLLARDGRHWHRPRGAKQAPRA